MKRAVVGLALVGLLLGGCEGFKEERGRGDAPVGEFNDDPRMVTNMPDTFPNIATACLEGADGFRVVVGTGDFKNVVVVEDDSC